MKDYSNHTKEELLVIIGELEEDVEDLRREVRAIEEYYDNDNDHWWQK